MDLLMKLVERWRSQAEVLDSWGARHEAHAARKCAAELESSIREWQLEGLTLAEAERESGYSYSSLQQLVAAGDVPNAGVKSKPRIRRCDLPRKAGPRSVSLVQPVPDLVADMMDDKPDHARKHRTEGACRSGRRSRLVGVMPRGPEGSP